MKQKQHRLAVQEAERLVARYQAGDTQAELAAAFRVHRQTVTSLLVRAGIPIRTRELPPEVVSEAAELYQAGWSLLQVGQKLGVDAKTVSRSFRARGLPVRPRNGWDQR